MKQLFPYEKLETWHDAKSLVLHIYKIVANFPANEQFGLSNQMKRAVVSVASNLAEGGSRMSLRDQAHFSQLAFSSLMEVACQADIAMSLSFIDESIYQELRQEIEMLSRKLGALRNSQVRRSSQ